MMMRLIRVALRARLVYVGLASAIAVLMRGMVFQHGNPPGDSIYPVLGVLSYLVIIPVFAGLLGSQLFGASEIAPTFLLARPIPRRTFTLARTSADALVLLGCFLAFAAMLGASSFGEDEARTALLSVPVVSLALSVAVYAGAAFGSAAGLAGGAATGVGLAWVTVTFGALAMAVPLGEALFLKVMVPRHHGFAGIWPFNLPDSAWFGLLLLGGSASAVLGARRAFREGTRGMPTPQPWRRLWSPVMLLPMLLPVGAAASVGAAWLRHPLARRGDASVEIGFPKSIRQDTMAGLVLMDVAPPRNAEELHELSGRGSAAVTYGWPLFMVWPGRYHACVAAKPAAARCVPVEVPAGRRTTVSID
jgi:hypothetical protein